MIGEQKSLQPEVKLCPEKMIGEHKSVQPEVKAFPEIQDKIGFERFSW